LRFRDGLDLGRSGRVGLHFRRGRLDRRSGWIGLRFGRGLRGERDRHEQAGQAR
jgi:hypothetical protein